MEDQKDLALSVYLMGQAFICSQQGLFSSQAGSNQSLDRWFGWIFGSQYVLSALEQLNLSDLSKHDP